MKQSPTIEIFTYSFFGGSKNSKNMLTIKIVIWCFVCIWATLITIFDFDIFISPRIIIIKLSFTDYVLGHK